MVTGEVPFNPLAMEGSLLDSSRSEEVCSQLDGDCLNAVGSLQVMPADYYARYSQHDLALWCHHRAFYFLPTHEAIEWSRQWLPEDARQALEIGSGNGALGRGLGLRLTDNRQQEWPEVRAHHARIQQPVINYHRTVETLDGLAASEKYRPEVIVAAWVTHRYRPDRQELGGNVYGVNEERLLEGSWLQRYVFFGHEHVHRTKPILGQKHTTHALPFLYSRSMQPGKNVVWIWEK